MYYLRIFILLVFAIMPKMALADASSNDSGVPDFSKTIFSGKFVPAPPPPSATPAPSTSSTTNGTSPTNTPPKVNGTPGNTNPFSQPPQGYPGSFNSYSRPPQSVQNSNSTSGKSTSATGAATTDTNYGPPPKPVLDEQQKTIIKDAQKEEEKMQSAFDKALNENYDTYTVPKEYYTEPFLKQNSHLPPVDFASYYAGLAFKYAKSDDYLNVRFFVKKYNFKDVIDENGNNLLMVAVNNNAIKTARMLLANQIFYINEQNKQNLRSSLHMAVMNSNYDMTRLLLSMGASTSLKDSTNMTPLDYSLLLDNSQINSLLVAYK